MDGGTFDWADAPRFHGDFVDPDPSYHGVSYTEAFGPARVHPQAAGPGPARPRRGALRPFNAWLFLQGLETLPLRIERHSENALRVAQWLETAPRSTGSTTRASPRTRRTPSRSAYLTGGFGGIITFGIKGGVDAGRTLIDSVKLFSLLANVGDAKSLDHPPGQHHPLSS